MNKRIIGPVAMMFLFLLCFGSPGMAGVQEKEHVKKEVKEKPKDKDSKAKGGVIGGVVGGVMGGVVGGVVDDTQAGDKGGKKGGVFGGVMGGVVGGVQGGEKGGVSGGITRGILTIDLDGDFLLQPRKIITFEVEHLLLKPTETISLFKTKNLRTESGLALHYQYTAPTGTKDEVGLEITPTIVEDKGIDLKIEILHNGKSVKSERILSRNFDPVLIELMENKDDHSKLVEKLTPLIQVVSPPQKYPKALDILEMNGHVLVMNDTMVINGTRGSRLSIGGGSEEDPAFLYFWIKGKGAYVLSFWPFVGADPIGVVSENTIRIRHGKDFFAWLSSKPILPEGKWRVWVRNNPDYDPISDMNMPEIQNDRLKAELQKENAAYTGVTSGRKALDRFFSKK